MSVLLEEIASIPSSLLSGAELAKEAIGRAAADWRSAAPQVLMTVARGTSDAAAAYAAYEFPRQSGILVGSFTPSLASLQDFTHPGDGLRALAISQSGASPDLVAALGAFPQRCRWALTNADGSALEEQAAIRIPIGAGDERSVAATKSFACSLLQIHRLAGELAERPAPQIELLAESAQRGIERPLDLGLLEHASSAFVLGRGPTLALAQEAAIKLKELTGLHAEAISSAEVMHGPRALAGPDLPVLGFAPPGGIGASVRDACAQLGDLGSPVVLAESCEEGELASLLELLCSFYPAAADLALARSLDPDSPIALSKITETR